MKKIGILFPLLLFINFYGTALGSNYDQYIERLINDGKLYYDDYLHENPESESFLENLFTLKHPIFQEDYPGSYEITDRQWNAFLNEVNRAKAGRFEETPVDKTVDNELNYERKSDSTYDSNSNENNIAKMLHEPGLTERRNEIAYQNPLWGEHKVSGGSGEVGQWIDYALLGAGAQDILNNESYDNFNLSNEFDSSHIESKVDNLPAYCDPPNPCPINYKSDDLPTPCDHDIEDTIEFNREWILRKMQNGECSCDNEHMDSCPVDSNENGFKASFSTEQKVNGKTFWENPYLRGQKRKRLVAKKRVKRSHIYRYNPYLMGQVHKSAVKKTGPYRPTGEKYM